MSDHDGTRDALLKLDRQRADEQVAPATVWDLLKGIHALPVLRGWVSLESRALLPTAQALDTGGVREGVVQALLTVPATEDPEEGFLPPWGYLAWRYPSLRLLAMVDLRQLVDLSDILPTVDQLADRDACATLETALKSGQPMPQLPNPM